MAPLARHAFQARSDPPSCVFGFEEGSLVSARDDLQEALVQINQRYYETIAELRALQFVASAHIAIERLRRGDTIDEVQADHQDMREAMAKIAFPDVDPAFSDFFAGELQSALARLLQQIETSFQVRAD